MTFRASLNDIVEENENGLLGTPAHWERVRLSDVVEILNGSAFSSDLFRPDEGVPLIRIRDINRARTEVGFVGEYDDKYLVQPGALLIGMDGDFNVALWSGPRALLNQRVCRLDVDEDYYRRRFLYYVLPGYLDAIHAHTSSVTVKHLSSRTVAEIPLPLPGRDEQDRLLAKIEELFSELDAGVEALERAQARLERYRASVLQAAVEGRLTEAWRRENPPEETGEELLERILVERRDRWEEEYRAKYEAKGKKPPSGWKSRYKEPEAPDTSELPALPEGWCWATAEQLTDPDRTITYGVVKLGSDTPCGVPTLRSSNVRPLHLDLEGVKEISPEIAKKYTRTFLAGGEVVITVRGTLGGVAVVPEECAGFNISREVAMLATIDQRMSATLAHFIASPPLQGWLSARTRGITYSGINIGDLKELPVPVPPLAEQHQITAQLEVLLSIAEAVDHQVVQQVEVSGQLRQAILKRAFEGRLVPQDPNDEPASVLLERIQAERDGKPAKKRRTSPPSTDQQSLNL